MSSPACALGVFAKTPHPGQVKTRLCPPLSPEQAAEFYTLSLAETVNLARTGGWQTVLFYSGSEDYFRTTFPELPRFPQQGDDLGARMDQALRMLLDQGFASAALIGSDTPDLPLSLLGEAFDALQRHELVVAPSLDGGYVLIGESRHVPELFYDIPWSTCEVLEKTRVCAASLGLDLQEITPWEDVDDLADLRRLMTRSPHSRCAAWARRLTVLCAAG